MNKKTKENAKKRKERDALTRAKGAKPGKKTTAMQWGRWTP